MKASELRIGNFIKWNGDLKRVSSVDYINGDARVHSNLLEVKGDGDFFSPFIKDMEGILIDEDWLLKFGYKRIDSKFGYWYTFRNYLVEETLFKDAYVLRQIMSKNESLCICHNLKHVHTLQNIIHSLTGTELTLSQTL